ncbi:MAG TPA: hypothetical protein VK327_12560 [Candidatus Paceibacterota bacterium]|nr:hypothetical protein [Candidatus Paceibacterota bacterium]
MPELPRQIAMAAGDYFMHGQDWRMRQAGLPGNACCAVLKLEPGFDIALLRRRIEASPIMDWLARVYASRPLPAVFPLRWHQAKAPEPILFEHQAQPGDAGQPWFLPPVVAQRELHAERAPGLVIDVFRHADGTSHLFLSWNHTHLDARGLDLLLNHINSDDPAKAEAAIKAFIHPKQLASGFRQWLHSIGLAHGSVKWLKESGAEPLFSLVRPGTRPASCKNSFRMINFTAEETAKIDARCQKFNCAFRRSHFYLAASLRGVHTVATQRGNKDGAYLIPVPHDTRKRGANGPIFSNHLSILFYRVAPQSAGRITDILGELSRQMTDQIRDKFPEACMAALEMFKPLPLGFYVKHLGKPSRGKFAAFSFSDSGETCAGMKEFCGGKISEVTHLVPAWRPPGLMLVFLRFGNRLSAQLSWVDDCMTPAEAETIDLGIRRALLEEES